MSLSPEESVILVPKLRILLPLRLCKNLRAHCGAGKVVARGNGQHRTHSSLRVVSVSRLHHQIFLLGSQMDPAVTRSRIGLIGSVAKAVLAAQFVLNLSVDLVDGLFLGILKKPCAGFL
jgi:hypothetical protein